eukprot:6213477-Pleurochrysis_carterae.AAC.7
MEQVERTYQQGRGGSWVGTRGIDEWPESYPLHPTAFADGGGAGRNKGEHLGVPVDGLIHLRQTHPFTLGRKALRTRRHPRIFIRQRCRSLVAPCPHASPVAGLRPCRYHLVGR